MSGDTSEELESLLERYNKAPESRLFAPLADAYRKNGQIDEAIGLCEKGLERYPDYASARVILAKCFYDKGATERARDEFARVLEIDPDNMVARKYMGEILLGEDRKEEAAEHLRRLLSIDPTNAEASRILEEIEAKFQVKEIDLSDKKQVRDERPGELATMTLAGIYAAQGYYNKALKIYRDILEREPGNDEVQGMVDKLQTLLDSSEKERGDTFDREEPALSAEVSEEELTEEQPEDRETDTAESEPSSEERGFILVETAKDDSTETDRDAGEERDTDGKSAGEETDEREGEVPERPVQRVREEEKEPPERSEGEARKEEEEPQNIENFQSWLRKLKGG